jgi:hypothetical protein
MTGLLARAQDSGQARGDLTVADVTLALLGVARTMAITSQSSPGQWRRHLAIVLDGMKAQHTERLPGLGHSQDQLDSDLREWSCHVLRAGSALP